MSGNGHKLNCTCARALDFKNIKLGKLLSLSFLSIVQLFIFHGNYLPISPQIIWSCRVTYNLLRWAIFPQVQWTCVALKLKLTHISSAIIIGLAAALVKAPITSCRTAHYSHIASEAVINVKVRHPHKLTCISYFAPFAHNRNCAPAPHALPSHAAATAPQQYSIHGIHAIFQQIRY